MSNPSNGPSHSGGARLDDARLPNGIMSATDNKLHEEVERFERWAQWGGIAVIAGVFAEFLLAWQNPSPVSFAGRWGTALADLIVAGGVAAEVLFSTKASNRQAELQRRSAERVAAANERAANAELQAQRLRVQLQWRRLSEEALTAFRSTLAAGPAGRINIHFPLGNPEAHGLALQLLGEFREAGWEAAIIAVLYNGFVAFNVWVPDHPPGVALIRTAIAAAGLNPFERDLPWPGVVFGATIHGAPRVFVGSKHPPD